MDVLRRFAVAVMVASVGAVGLHADDQAKIGAKGAADKDAGAKKVCQVSNAIGATVKNHQGKDLGSINDIALTRNGEFKYAIVGYGGVAGVGQTQVAIPWRALHVNYQDKTVMVDLAQDRLERLPKLEGTDYTELSNANWRMELDKQFSHADAKDKDGLKDDDVADAAPDAKDRDLAKGDAAGDLIFANNLIGAYIRAQDKENVGEVHDLVVMLDHKMASNVGKSAPATAREANQADRDAARDTARDAAGRNADAVVVQNEKINKENAAHAKHSGMQRPHRVDFVILDIGGVVGIGETQIAIPFSQLTLRDLEDNKLEVAVNMTEKQLTAAPTLKQENFNDLMNPAFVTETRRYFGADDRREIETELQKKDRKLDSNRDENRSDDKAPDAKP